MGCDKDFAEHFLPDRWTILGVKLPPFKVGHLLLLDRVESPYVTGLDRRQEDLLTAIYIAAQSYTKASENLWRKMSMAWRWWTFRQADKLNAKHDYFLREDEKFAAMLTLARGGVPQVYHDVEGEKTHAPYAMILIGDLMRHFGYSESEVLEMPLLKANYMREKMLLDEGAASFPEWWEKAKAE